MLPQKENPTAKQTDKQTGGETSKAHKPKRLAHLCARDAVLLGNNLGAFELHHRSNPFGTAAVCRPTGGHWRQYRRTERLWATVSAIKPTRRSGRADLREDPVAALGEALAVLSVDRVIHRQA